MQIKTKTFIKLIVFLIALTFMAGCEKFLDEKPDQKLSTPSTIEDLQALLNNSQYLNSSDPFSGEISSDDYYLTEKDWRSLSNDGQKRMYTWENDHLFTSTPNDWLYLYRIVYFSNSVLEQLRVLHTQETGYYNVKGQALFFRGKAFLQTAWLWCNAFDPKTANEDLGIPLRLGTDFNEASVRSSLLQTYEQIVDDLTEASKLLPEKIIHPTRPTKGAAYAMLSRTFLSMGNYEKAKIFADSCLSLHGELMDFNSLDSIERYPIPQFNIEVVFESFTPPPAPLSSRRAKINETLYSQYDKNDLRKYIFFSENADGSHAFKGSYEKGPALFTGIAIDEIYLIKAECMERLGKSNAALDALNALLVKRWRKGEFVPYTQANIEGEILTLVLEERRKELLMRGLRWIDLKRLNLEGRDIEIRRILGNESYVLYPNDNRYALPIPEDVVDISGIEGNPR